MTPECLVLGLGNLLLGDEGVGVEVARALSAMSLPEGVEVLDGGTGSMMLLEPMHAAKRLILVDATLDGQPPGTLQRLVPRFARDFPPSLCAHDIGLRDLLETFYLLGQAPDVVLYAISITPPDDLVLGLSPEVQHAADQVIARIQEEWVREGAPQQA